MICPRCAAGWEEDFQQTQRYYNTMLGHYGAAPAVATPELLRASGTQPSLQQLHPVHPLLAGLDGYGRKMAQPQCTGRAHQRAC